MEGGAPIQQICEKLQIFVLMPLLVPLVFLRWDAGCILPRRFFERGRVRPDTGIPTPRNGRGGHSPLVHEGRKRGHRIGPAFPRLRPGLRRSRLPRCGCARGQGSTFRMPPDSKVPPVTTINAPPVEPAPSDVESIRTLELEGDGEDLAVYFRLFETGYPVEKCSIGFTWLSGPSVLGARLLEWVVGTASFIDCVEELRRDALREGQGIHAQRAVQVRLRPPHLHRLRRELSAEAVLSLLHNDATAEAQLWTAKVELRDTKVLRKRRGCSQRSSCSVAESIDESVDEFVMLEEMEVYFSMFESGYRVTGCSHSFPALVGLPAANLRMLDLVIDEEAFITETQVVFNSAYQKGDFTFSRVCKDVRIKRPLLSGSLLATIEISIGHNDGAEDFRLWTLKATLLDVRASARARPGGPAPLGAAAPPEWPEGRGSACAVQRRGRRTASVAS
ncbi:unnamed protein product [Prorocentrum cordatum]|uniref:Uncharacterized protein n=1 Tax=Prorocentrum cordatum TaxID=2364126 RepID=A0ABN9QA73_9DINO|nr:unnamed protein product [Polarella glacialis]